VATTPNSRRALRSGSGRPSPIIGEIDRRPRRATGDELATSPRRFWRLRPAPNGVVAVYSTLSGAIPTTSALVSHFAPNRLDFHSGPSIGVEDSVAPSTVSPSSGRQIQR